ncbi:indolepyruvate ferredoxin oxidoreductase subunit alpha [Methanosalsum natronophilum]|uniref:Indolepyruvate oxidoreductase subunit IorA n=1 Tax=Methanosalsum natronophilum TaxID=768733 RepID=A0A424YVI0_9EURY|nr:MAG: indolepyruvate ferredoxin oxidoreductase subunit alpha [Methanosalsum natronophilum]
MKDREYMLGNAAIARGIIEGGGKVISGYPGTPSSEIIGTLASMKERDFYVEWSVNEKVALEVAAGAAMAGIRSVVTMKHVGLNVAADPLMTLAYMGVEGGMVIIVADDPGCHSSQNEQDTRRYSEFSMLPCFDPATPQEAKDMVSEAFSFSEKFQLPVIFRSTTRISHGKSDITLNDIDINTKTPFFTKDVDRWVMIPKNACVRHPQLIDVQEDIKNELQNSRWNKLDLSESSTIGIIAAGIASVYAEEAMIDLDVEASYLKIGTYPLPDDLISKMLDKVDEVLIIEELEPFVEDKVRAISNDLNKAIKIYGKDPKLIPRDGELNVNICKIAISNAFNVPDKNNYYDYADKINSLSIPERPPVMCPGCSHRATYYAMRKAFGADAIYPSDIGCYTLGVQSGTVDTTLCMGGSITVASGIFNAGEKRPICCSIGDSTFLHTGINGLLNATYNKSNITITILDNRTTAMTGHQPNPGMGQLATGEKTIEVCFEGLCKSLGAEFVETVDPFDIPSTIEAFKKARDYQGTSVIIAKQPCVILSRRMGVKNLPFHIFIDKCNGCKACIRLGCPAIEFDEKNKHAKINSMCTGCGSCVQMCKFDAIVEVSK